MGSAAVPGWEASKFEPVNQSLVWKNDGISESGAAAEGSVLGSAATMAGSGAARLPRQGRMEAAPARAAISIRSRGRRALGGPDTASMPDFTSRPTAVEL